GVFERDVLPGHLSRTRWYPEHKPTAIQPVLVSAVPFCDIGDNKPWIAFFEATQNDRKSRYVLPMQIEWVRFDREHYNPNAFSAHPPGGPGGNVARCRSQPDLHGPVPAQLAGIAERAEKRATARVLADQQFFRPRGARAATGRAGRIQSLRQHLTGRRRIC